MTIQLGISASGDRLSCVARTDDGTLHHGGDETQRGANLPAVVDGLFRKLDCRPADLTAIRLDLGPGSYTGLRVAVTFARTALQFADVDVFTATSVELIALATWRSPGFDGTPPLRPVLDARRSRFHVARLRLDDDVQFDEEPRAVDVDTLLAALRPDDVIVADSRLHGLFEGRAHQLLELPRYDASLLFDPALSPRPAAAGQLLPLYLMGSYAED